MLTEVRLEAVVEGTNSEIKAVVLFWLRVIVRVEGEGPLVLREGLLLKEPVRFGFTFHLRLIILIIKYTKFLRRLTRCLSCFQSMTLIQDTISSSTPCIPPPSAI